LLFMLSRHTAALIYRVFMKPAPEYHAVANTIPLPSLFLSKILRKCMADGASGKAASAP